jgi:alpha-glucosidase
MPYSSHSSASSAAVPLVPHHDGSSLHVDDGALHLGDSVRVRIRVPAATAAVASVAVRSNPDHEPTWDDAVDIGTVDGWQWWEAEIVVANPRHGYRWLLRYEDGSIAWLDQSGLHRGETLDANDFALITTPPPPAWLFDSVMYQIFPDRFARSAAADAHATPAWAIPAAWDEPVDPVMPGRSQQFYGGDLDGIVEHLDHLVDLGATLLYLTPVFPGASNHRYDASSFTQVDALLGGDDAYVRLVEAAHARGLRVIGDLTTNHSGNGHEWFRAAYGNPGAPEQDYYYFRDDAATDYEMWLGTPTLPKFEWASEGLRRRFIDGPDSVVGQWLLPPFSIDGWRIDVANMTGRLGDIDHNADVRQTILRTMLAVNPDTVLLAESTNDATSDLQGDAWHGAMTYTPFTRPLWAWLSAPNGAEYRRGDGSSTTEPWFFGQPVGGIPRSTARELMDASIRFTAGIPWRVRLGNMQALDTHDTARFATNAASGTIPIAVGLSMTMPGLPVVFAGDEFGLTGTDGEDSRTPMPWGSEQRPATAERLALYRELIGLRRAHPALATGGMRWLFADDDSLAFVRESAEESVLVIATTGELEASIVGGALPGVAAARRVFGEATLVVADGGAASLTASGPAFAVWTLPGIVAPSTGRRR